MGVLSEIVDFVGNLFELVAYALAGLIVAAIWAVGFVIDLVTDILGWINDRLDELLDDGATSVNVIDGNLLGNYILNEEAKGNVQVTSLSDLQTLRNGVVNVATDDYGNIIDDQMIRSSGGLSSQTRSQFAGNSVLKIKLQ